MAAEEFGNSIAGAPVEIVSADPLNIADFSSVLLQAQASGAKVIALANAGADMTNSVKQAAEFGITRGQALVAPTVFLTDVDAMGLAPRRTCSSPPHTIGTAMPSRGRGPTSSLRRLGGCRP